MKILMEQYKTHRNKTNIKAFIFFLKYSIRTWVIVAFHNVLPSPNFSPRDTRPSSFVSSIYIDSLSKLFTIQCGPDSPSRLSTLWSSDILNIFSYSKPKYPFCFHLSIYSMGDRCSPQCALLCFSMKLSLLYVSCTCRNL